MKKRTLGFKLVIGGIAAVLIPLLVVGLFAVEKASTSLTEASKSQALNIATDLAAAINLVLVEQVKKVESLAAIDAFRQAAAARMLTAVEEQTLNRQIHAMLKGLGDNYQGIFLGRNDGILFAGSLANGETPYNGIDVNDRDYFQMTSRSGN